MALSWIKKLLGISPAEAKRPLTGYGSVLKDFPADTLTGVTAIKTYYHMINDSQVAGALQQLYGSITGGPARFRHQNPEIEQWVNDTLDNIPGSFVEVISSAATMIAFGYSLQEVVWAYSGGKWIPAEIVGKDVRNYEWVWSSKGNMWLLQSSSGFKSSSVPAGKFIICKNGNDQSSPYGRSVLKPAWKNWWSKTELIKIQLHFAERNVSPIAAGTSEIPHSPEDEEAFLNMMDELRQRSAILVPNGFKLDMLYSNNPNGGAQLDQFIAYHDSQIARAILAESLTLEGGGVGARSYGQSATHASVLRAIGANVRSKIATAINEQLIYPMIVLNFGQDTPKGALIIQEPPVDQLKDYAQAIKYFVDAGAITGKEDWVMELAGLGSSLETPGPEKV